MTGLETLLKVILTLPIHTMPTETIHDQLMKCVKYNAAIGIEERHDRYIIAWGSREEFTISFKSYSTPVTVPKGAVIELSAEVVDRTVTSVEFNIGNLSVFKGSPIEYSEFSHDLFKRNKVYLPLGCLSMTSVEFKDKFYTDIGYILKGPNAYPFESMSIYSMYSLVRRIARGEDVGLASTSGDEGFLFTVDGSDIKFSYSMETDNVKEGVQAYAPESVVKIRRDGVLVSTGRGSASDLLGAMRIAGLIN